jgi:hypothetical protein
MVADRIDKVLGKDRGVGPATSIFAALPARF